MESTPLIKHRASRYRIQVEGTLSSEWAPWLNGHLVEAIYPEPSANLTHIDVKVPDQAALRGLVNKLWDLNLVIISISGLF